MYSTFDYYHTKAYKQNHTTAENPRECEAPRILFGGGPCINESALSRASHAPLPTVREYLLCGGFRGQDYHIGGLGTNPVVSPELEGIIQMYQN